MIYAGLPGCNCLGLIPTLNKALSYCIFKWKHYQVFSEDLLIGLLRAKHVVVFSGAGMSSESGIPTFRDAQTGLWEQYNPQVLASPEGYLADKSLVWGWYESRRNQVLSAEPNAGHFAIVELSDYVERLTVITQNVDDLHERAGNRVVKHLHGSLHNPRCFSCAEPYVFSTDHQIPIVKDERIEPPRCAECNGYVRPGVVWFGESLPEDQWKQAEEAVLNCDVIFSIGTSSLVWPAAKLPDMAAVRGAKIVQINTDVTPLDSKAHYNYKGKAGVVLPALLESLSDLLD